jgi:hypothetical protein
MPDPKLRLRLSSPPARLKLVWSRRPDGVLACGRVTVELIGSRWLVIIGGVHCCRHYGYASEREAMAAAPHLRAVRELLKKGK